MFGDHKFVEKFIDCKQNGRWISPALALASAD
jgi:hypothetical protein